MQTTKNTQRTKSKNIKSQQKPQIQNVLSEGVKRQLIFFLVDEGIGDQNSICHYKWAIIDPPAKRHLNGVSLTSR